MSRLLTEQLVQSIIQQLAYRLPLVGGYFSVNFFRYFLLCLFQCLLLKGTTVKCNSGMFQAPPYFERQHPHPC